MSLTGASTTSFPRGGVAGSGYNKNALDNGNMDNQNTAAAAPLSHLEWRDAAEKAEREFILAEKNVHHDDNDLFKSKKNAASHKRKNEGGSTGNAPSSAKGSKKPKVLKEKSLKASDIHTLTYKVTRYFFYMLNYYFLAKLGNFAIIYSGTLQECRLSVSSNP
jgi:hypothetical protein